MDTITKKEKSFCNDGIKIYDKAIELNPQNAELYYNRGLVKSSECNHEGAIKDLQRQNRQNKKHTTLHLFLLTLCHNVYNSLKKREFRYNNRNKNLYICLMKMMKNNPLKLS